MQKVFQQYSVDFDTVTTVFKSIFFSRQYVTLHIQVAKGSFKMCKMTGQENGSLFSTKRCNKVNLDFKSIFSRCGGVITDNVVYSKVDNKYGVPLSQGSFKYYVIKEVGGWVQKMAIFDDLQYSKSSKKWVGGPKKVKNMMT